MQSGPRVDVVTICGIALVLMPLLAMAHELVGHAAMCAALGGRVLEAGAFYVSCDFEQGTLNRKLVALAGPAISGLLSLLAWLSWRGATRNLTRLILWYVWIGAGFSCAGYFVFSGMLGIGDVSPEAKGGVGPLPSPGLWRVCFIVVGVAAYVMLIKTGKRSLTAMLGSGPRSASTRRRVAHIYYAVVGATAVIASLPNPLGMVISLTSAAAANLGGNAGFISLGIDRDKRDEPLPFTVERNWLVLAAGICATVTFSLVLGPSITFKG